MPKKKTHEEFVKEFKDKYGDDFTLLDEYTGSTNKIRVRHNNDYCGNHIRVMRARDILTKLSCRICEGLEENNTSLQRKLHNIEIIENYKNKVTKILVKCKVCNYEWSTLPLTLLQGHGCPKCNGGVKINHKEFCDIVKQKYNGDYEILGEYIGCNEEILVRHHCKDGKYYEYMVKPRALMHKTSKYKGTCPKCSGILKKSDEEFKLNVKKTLGNEYKIIGSYINSKTKIKVKHNCKKCNYYEWEIIPNALLRGNGCPVCANKKVIKDVNDIATTHPHLVKYFVYKEDTYKYSYGSDQKVSIICPICKYKTKSKISNLTIYETFICKRCSDKISYPEKFIRGLLEQLDLDFKTEYSPKWIKPKRYDFYIKNNDCIIETHGEQHYKATSRKGKKVRTLEEEQANDKYKKEIALKNGIKHYITLDCRESNMEWIKKSIINSELVELFNLDNIDWLEIAKFANKNIVKEVCDYWNSGIKNINIISKKSNISASTTRNYLVKGAKLGLCDYMPECVVRNKAIKSKHFKQIFCLEEQKIYYSISQCCRLHENFIGSNLSRNIRKRKGKYKGFTFKYVEDLTPEERVKYNIDEKLKELENK